MPNIVYYVNIKSEHDIYNQCLPFLSEVPKIPCFNDHLKVVFYEEKKEVPHQPLDSMKTINIIKSYIKSNLKDSYQGEKNNLKKSYKNYKIKNLIHYYSARIDIINQGDSQNSTQILDISDDYADVSFPSWFANDDGKGVVIQSYSGKLDLKIKCINDGKLNIRLRGIDVKYNKTKKIPIFVEFTDFKINGKNLLKKPIIASLEDYYKFDKFEVKDGDIIFIHLKWSPFKC